MQIDVYASSGDFCSEYFNQISTHPPSFSEQTFNLTCNSSITHYEL